MTFEHPHRLFLLLVSAGLVAVYVLYWVWKRRRIAAIGDPAIIEAMVTSRSARKEVARFSLVATALALLTVALAGPQWGEKQQSVERRGIDVVFALDISRSMLAEDVPPSRLAAAKAEIDRTLNRLTGDRVGLVAYAGIAFTQCPLTSDYSAIRRFLRHLDPEDMPVQGTAVGRAIREGIRLLEGRRSDDAAAADERTMERGHDQLIVLFTDGEDHETLPIEAAQTARERGIRVFTVAIGTETGAQIPEYGPGGRRRGFFRDRYGREVVSRVDSDGLNEIANAGGGIAMTFTGEGSVANALAREIDRLQSAELESILRPEQENRFYVFVAPAVLLLLIALGFSDRKRGAPHLGWLPALLATTLFVPWGGGCGDTFLYESEQVEDGLRKSRTGRWEEGLAEVRAFRDEMAPEDLIDPEGLAYNEGVILLRADNLEEAKARLLASLGSQSEEVRFRAYYNLGNVAYAEERWEDALQRFTQALELRRDDKDSKWNLELTLRQLFPPCVTFEDELEENDVPEDAALWPTVAPPEPGQSPQEQEQPKAVICGGDADWISIPHVLDESHVSVSVELTRLRDDTGGAELPDEIAVESVWIALYGGEGWTVLGSDTGQTDAREAQEDARRLHRELVNVFVPLGLAPQQEVLLEIGADLGLEYEYTLDVTVIPPCTALDDQLEENDTRADAPSLEPGDYEAQMCLGDDDWFTFPALAGDTIFVDIQPGPSNNEDPDAETAEAHGDEGESAHTIGLRAELYRQGESVPVQITEGRDGMLELALFDILEPGDFTLRVVGIGEETDGPYQLSLFRFPPCVVGDDDFEENDGLHQTAPLDPAGGPYRHNRLCFEDQDWFQVPVEQGEHVSTAIEYEEPGRSISLSLMAPGTYTVIASGAETESDPPPELPPGELGAPQPRARFSRQLHLEDPHSTGDYPIRVMGEPGFYNIVFPDPNEDNQCDNPQTSEDEQEPQDEESDQEQQDEQSQNDQEQREQERDDQQEQPHDEQQAEADATETHEPFDEAEERLRLLLDSLSEEDVNLQLHQALQELPPIQMDRQW